MQVNVKELTGVLHLSLVFMNVLVLQSFLAVSLQVCWAVQAPSWLQVLLKCVVSTIPSPQHLQVSQQSQVFYKCDRCCEPLVQLPSQVTSCVWLPSLVV